MSLIGLLSPGDVIAAYEAGLLTKAEARATLKAAGFSIRDQAKEHELRAPSPTPSSS